MVAANLEEFMEITSKMAREFGLAAPGKEECRILYEDYMRTKDFLGRDGDLEFERNDAGALELYFRPHRGQPMEPQ